MGAGQSGEQDADVQSRNQAALATTRDRLRRVPLHIVQDVERALGGAWRLQRKWLEPHANGDFKDLADWIRYASIPEGNAASVSLFLNPTELDGDGGAAAPNAFYAAIQKFAPLMDAVYATDGEASQVYPAAGADGASTSELNERISAPYPTHELPATPGGAPRVWVIAAGEGAREWERFRRDRIAAIGWGSLGDLQAYGSKDSVWAGLRERYPSSLNPRNDALACHQFAKEMKPGDLVYAKRGWLELLGRGVVESDYRFEPERGEYAHVRTVRWEAIGPWKLARRVFPTKTLTEMTAYPKAVRVLDDAVRRVAARPAPEPFTVDDALAELFISRSRLEELLATLTRKKNLILAGPPGVGKTFAARLIAYALMREKDPSRVEMVQFHQSYAYEDFVQGWRPGEAGGFERRNGIFHSFCERARDDARPHVFIIDEVNRGNLSKIFGELMMLVETDKRGESFAIPLTYSRPEERFFVPSNVYLLGMMNTADRSLAMVDYALRRRFAFAEMEPAFGTESFRAHLRALGVSAPLLERIDGGMQALNREIVEDKDLGPGFELGHSFFVPHPNNGEPSEAWYTSIVRTEIEPLLREYWFDSRGKVKRAMERLLR